MPSPFVLHTPVLLRELPSGDVLVQSLVDPQLATTGASAVDASAELARFLSGYLAQLTSAKLARFSAADAPVLTHVSVRLPRADLPSRLQPHARVSLSCVVRAGAQEGERWVFVPGLDLTCFVHRAESLEQVVGEEILRITSARELGAADYLSLLPAAATSVELLPVRVQRGGSSDGEPTSYRQRAEAARKREADELLRRVGRRLPVEGRRAGPLLQRGAELSLLSGLLGQRARQSVLLVGEAGVGKSALFASWLEQSESSAGGRPVYASSGAELVAGMSGFGEWQERLGQVLEALELLDAILYLEDFADLLLDRQGELASYLRDHVEQRRVRLVGELSVTSLDEVERRQPSLLSALVRVRLEPLPASATRAVLAAHAAHDRQHEPHRAQLTDAALAALEDIASRYLPYAALPGSVLRLYRELRSLERVRQAASELTVDAPAVYAWFSAQSGVPLFLLREDTPLRAAELARQLDQQLIGQAEAKRHVIDTLCMVKARLAPTGKPLASFLLVGPTGVGKTELARALARILFADPSRLLRFDMSEYAGPDAASRLFRGHDRHEGMLTRKVREQPFCVVLLDEIEKAHPAVFDLLLQLLGEARLSDEKGRTAYFHNAIVIMTSNLGTAERTVSGFAASGALSRSAPGSYQAALRETFRPELVNRLDRVITFLPLTRDEVVPVVRLLVRQIAGRRGFSELGTTLEVDEEVLGRLADEGYSPAYGARGMRRHVERALTAPLARLLAQHGSRGATLVVSSERPVGRGHLLASESAGGVTCSLLKRTTTSSAGAQRVEQGLTDRRRLLGGYLKLARIEALESEAETLVVQLAQQRRGRTPDALVARLRARHQQVASVLEQLHAAYDELASLEELSYVAALSNEEAPSLTEEASALSARFESALLRGLVLDEPHLHEVSLLVQELDPNRALDLWLGSLLDAAERLRWRVLIHPEGGGKERFSTLLEPARAREALLAPERSFRSALVRISGPEATVKAGLEAGVVHYVFSAEASALLSVSILAHHIDLSEQELAHPALHPLLPSQFDVARRARPSRVFDVAEGRLSLLGRAIQLGCTPRQHFARIDEIALCHLLLFESDPALDRSLALRGPLVRPEAP